VHVSWWVKLANCDNHLVLGRSLKPTPSPSGVTNWPLTGVASRAVFGAYLNPICVYLTTDWLSDAGSNTSSSKPKHNMLDSNSHLPKRVLVRWSGESSKVIHQPILTSRDDLDKELLLAVQDACAEVDIKIPCE